MVIDYRDVVRQSRAELRERIAERESTERRIRELRTALRALAKFIPESDREQVMQEVRESRPKGGSLTEALLELLRQPQYKTGLTSAEIRQKLEETGFDMDDYSQPLAVVNNTVSRLIEQKKVTRVFTGSGKGVAYKITAAGLLKED